MGVVTFKTCSNRFTDTLFTMVAYGKKYFWVAVQQVTIYSHSVAGKKTGTGLIFFKSGSKENLSVLASLLPVC